MRVMDLFSGIGGFSLGLKRAGGFRTVAYCEIDPYCQQVLQARMLDGSLDTAPICTDITRLDGKPWAGRVDVICGGFPCQDISLAGKGAGLAGERSGLWREMGRLVRQVGPRYVLVENVSAILDRGLGDVLADLAASGYDAEWDCLPASAFGAYHERDRTWIVAHAKGMHGNSRRLLEEGRDGGPLLQSGRLRRVALAARGQQPHQRLEREPGVARLVSGLPHRTHRLAALGNSVYPAVVEWIGRRIVEAS